MDEEFKDVLKRILREELEEAEEPEDTGGDDTITITRKQFCKVSCKLFGTEGSNTDKYRKAVKIGRLAFIQALIGKERYTAICSTLIDLFQEYLFGVNVERSEFRIDGEAETQETPDAE